MYYFNHVQNPQQQAAAQHNKGEQRLAQAYVPPQAFRMLYSAEEALRIGTIFKELDQAYGGRR